MKMERTLTKALTAALFLTAGSANALIVDGINTSGTEYDGGTTVDWGFHPDGGSYPGGLSGSLSYQVDGNGDIFVLIAAPTDWTDNIYGDSSIDPANPSPWPKEHTFSKLFQSDMVDFGLDLNGDGNSDGSVNIDLLNGDKTKGKNKTYSNFEVNWTDGTGAVLAASTSLYHNLCGTTAYGSCLATAKDSDDSGFGGEIQVMYEFKLDGSLVSNFSAASIVSPLMHSSPAKIKNHDFEPDCKPGECPTTVPEPSSILLLLSGLIGLGARKLKR